MTQHTTDRKTDPALHINGWEVIIGLEVHAQVNSQAKLFSGAPTDFGADPNTQVSFIDAGFPGMLPVINELCVAQAIKTGLGLHAEINLKSIFDRKNYFYADLPLGYQISQFHHPIVGRGYLDIETSDGATKRIGITRLHLEQDAGKSIHDQNPTSSYIDLNRSGIALMEIVSDPDMRSRDEAMAFMRKLRALVRSLGTCDGNMEQGSMRADVNVSLRRPGEPLGTRAEIKNLNSVRFLGQAVDFEIKRQMALLEKGESIAQETRLFDPTKNETRSMRSKEEAHDYRYFPDPDLPPLIVEQSLVDRILADLPELPDEKKARFIKDYALKSEDAAILSGDGDVASYFEESVSHETLQNAKLLSNWIIGELFAILNQENLTIKETKISSDRLAGLIVLIEKGTISGKIAKDVFAEMWQTSKSASEIVQEKGLEQISDGSAIRAAIDTILADNPDKIQQYKDGKDKLFGFFVGQVMKVMAGKANPKLVNEILQEKLKDSAN